LKSKILRRKFITIFLALLSCSKLILAQANSSGQDSTSVELANKMWNLDVLFGGDLPMADMAKRFGANYRLGVGVKYKTQRNYIFGAKLEFLFGNKMHEDSLLQNVMTDQGGLIALNGDLLNIGKFERGYLLGLQFGKVLPWFQVNKNSGPLLLSSIGFMQHKIKFFDQEKSFPQLNGEYFKGYDRLTNGIFFEQFIGYAYFASNKLLNFNIGFNLTYGFTRGRRTYLFDVGRPDNAQRHDILTGLKLGWTLPIYKKKVEEIYY
jgi:hypothetical protein